MPAQRYRVLHRMNFESPYVEMPMRLTIRQNLKVFGMLYGVADLAERIEELAEALDLTESARPADRQTFGRAEDPGLARQGADQFARTAAARRADRLARSRHRRLGAGAARALLPRARRHGAARLAQHGRGRTAVRTRHHHEARPHRGRRHAGAAACPLRPPHARGSVSSTSRAAAAKRARPRNDHAHDRKRAWRFRRAGSRR